jgi:ATP-binding cassette subfamily G (WHITE) protein 2
VNMYIGGPLLLAILGPSGSGKTSLIDIISGRKNTGRVDGYIFMNGRQVKSGQDLRQKIGYVMQDDVMPSTTTVKEYLSFHALLRYIPQNKSNIIKERASKVRSIIQQLHLDSCADTPIGDAYRKGASGGEQRRLSIGVKLIAGKDIIVMDEPTSGLDSNSSQLVVLALKTIVKSGKGVAVSIHQPSSRLFHQFDRVLLLSKSGEVVYMGDSKSMVGFFSNAGAPMPSEFNPAEFAPLPLAIVGFIPAFILSSLVNLLFSLEGVLQSHK